MRQNISGFFTASTTTGAVFLALFCVSAFCASTAFGQSSVVMSSGKVSDVALAVWELPSRNEVDRVRRGGTFSMAAGETRMLRIFSPRGSNPSGERAYLSARINLHEGRGAELREVDFLRGTAILEISPSSTARELTIGYDLGRNYDAPGLYHGTFTVRVEDRGSSPPPGDLDGLTAELQRLYRGVLLRDPDAEEHREVRRIERDGHPALVEIAQRIAASDESRRSLPRRGVSWERRLESLYGELLDLRRHQVDERDWKLQQRRLADGRVIDVVIDLVQSVEYLRQFGRRADDRQRFSKVFVESARSQLGKPYRVDPLGEGPNALVDRDPRLADEAFDAVTLIELALAMAEVKSSGFSANDSEAAERKLRRTLDEIRYYGGRISFTARHHFFVTDWIPNNTRLVEDVTRELGGNAVRSLEREVDRELFYRYHGLGNGYEVPEELKTPERKNRRSIGYAAWYLPVDVEMLGRLEEGMIVVFLGQEEGLFARHVGILTRDRGRRLQILHASPAAGKVVEESLSEMLQRERRNLIGYQILRLRDDPSRDSDRAYSNRDSDSLR